MSIVNEYISQFCEQHAGFINSYLNGTVELDKPEEGDEPQLPWYTNEDSDIFWPKYKQLLLSKGRKWEEAVESIEATTFSILNQMPNPLSPENKFTGLVVGDVQSGKTAHFTALIARAVDKGYNFVIVLSGIFNNLRNQTQKRLDQELVSNPFLSRDESARFIQLTEHGEFTGDANLRPFLEDEFARISIAVTKKNTDSLRAFRTWIESIPTEKRRRLKLLIIDDEADFATINTTDPRELNSTTINSLLRSIINKFQFSAYIGYTATPYANFFIQKSRDRATFEFLDGLEELNSTLHPRNMIFKINPSTNYAGISRFFGEEYRNDGPFRIIPDGELPRLISFFDKPGRNNIPMSLANAIIEFVLVECIRRKIETEIFDNKMMIHTIRTTSDMLPIAHSISQMFEYWMNFSPRSDSVADRYYRILFKVWENRFCRNIQTNTEDEIVAMLPTVLREIKFVVLNQSTRSTVARGFESSLIPIQ